MAVEVYSRVFISCLNVQVYASIKKQALLPLEAEINLGICTNTIGVLDHTYTELSVARATLVDVELSWPVQKTFVHALTQPTLLIDKVLDRVLTQLVQGL